MDLQIGQLQRIANSSIFWAWILDFACFRLFLLRFWIQSENLTQNLVSK